ncbi:hypothetical protein [Brevundimonas sp. SL130]|uniref:hypothetical protein n=1 Tax=Brevundimonas sp. SL130 TaxID=2995143 RepID=UPI00226D0722|nr:hypothetical protein [Brevundimonas sp. SL130]WAC58993.1 hypothetical protein OU998_12310 [Brevundimonas sp. SL130]
MNEATVLEAAKSKPRAIGLLAIAVTVIALGLVGWTVGNSIAALNSDDCVAVTTPIAGGTQISRTCS